MTTIVKLVHKDIQFPVEAKETILEAAIKAGVDIDYSCMQGTCGTCKSQVITGDVALNADDYSDAALSATEYAHGLRLLCVGFARSETVVLDL